MTFYEKTLIILILLISFSISCQTNAENMETNLSVNVIESPKLQPETSSTAKPKLNDGINSKIGNVEIGNNCVRLFIENPSLKIGDEVQIVLTGTYPQKILTAKIIENAECKDDYFGELIGNNPKAELAFYLLMLTDKNANESGFGIGIVNLDERIKTQEGLAVVDLDKDNKKEYFRSCASNEGLHLTVWKGRPLIGKRIWHSYYHFSYDTEPDCKKNDYE